MPWRLREDVYSCVSGGMRIFLDTREDRYFCLPPATQVLLDDVLNEESLSSPKVPELPANLLVWDPLTSAAPARPTILSPASDLTPAASSDWLETLRLVAAEIMITAGLRVARLSTLIEFCSVSPLAAGGSGNICKLKRLARAAADASLFLRETDRCLVRALTVHRLSRRKNIDTKLVFGVRTNPFGAHAWVQFEEQVVVGEFEQARLYTPIAMFG